MYPILADDLANLPDLLDVTRQAAVRALAGLNARPVAVAPTVQHEDKMPEDGIGLRATLAEFTRRWEPGFSGSAGPRYLGFVTGGTTPAALAGDWLTGTFDQNVGSAKDSSATALEHETVARLGELFGLRHAGAFVTGATMSNVVGLAIAREWLGERKGVSIADAGVGALGDVTVLSGAPHSSVFKALAILGIGRDRLRLVPTLPGREAVDVTALADALATTKGPSIVVANAGTVNTVDFDDLVAIAELKNRFDFWLHTDGAFGAFAALSPRHAHLVAGLGEADSVCVDLHKWLNVPYDAGVQFTRRPDLQVAVFRNAAAYLGMPTENPDFVHLTPESSRRLRALPAWFALTAYGRAGHRDIVERNVDAAHQLGELLAGHSKICLLAPVRLNVVCFTVADPQRVCDAVAASGEAFVTPTVLDGVPGIRAAFSNWRTTEADVARVATAIMAAC
ncbi:MAG TPA: pyridoxal-dependent decarboxylase [Pseudonocardiaceae bacterium]|nr:pyridoxal-dependent decarboxylase [Pseudonocardiaceae bacterium]